MSDELTYILKFKDIALQDVALVGGKNASLGEMFNALTLQDILVPDGFAITASAYRDLLTGADAWAPLHALLDGLDKSDIARLAEVAKSARDIVYQIEFPASLTHQILSAYRDLQGCYGADFSVAVRSSATAEDLPTASFAGQHDSYLNISGEDALIDACRRCFASLFTDRAISYRIDHGFDHFDVALSIGVMKMVRSDLASSGVMFSLDTESGFRDVVFITGIYGLGENIVQGMVDPDEFYVHKPTFNAGHRMVLRRRLGLKQLTMRYADSDSKEDVCNLETALDAQKQFCISDEEVLMLADYAIKTEKHYSELAGVAMPMDMEWAKDGIDGKLYLIQARPETVASQAKELVLEEYSLKTTTKALINGRSIGHKAASGIAHVITNVAMLADFKAGEVLVADMTMPDWEPVMKKAAAIVTNRGGRTCHAAILARELGIPAVVGTGDATSLLSSPMAVTVDCSQGETGAVYQGLIPFSVTRTDVTTLSRPKTKVMMNVGNPDIAFQLSNLPCDGVGLARMEFIISNSIKAHPMALLYPDRVMDKAVREQLASLTEGYASGEAFFIEKLSEGVATIAAAFYPKPVIVRMSDFKTNEYAALLGGDDFEPHEANPMLGFRGAARYIHPEYSASFAMECAAMCRVREEMGLSNVILMIPFCRRIDEAQKVLALMSEHGLARGVNGLKVYMMCEIPNNVVQIDAFLELFDGFSIGSNDLTQLVLGVDRDSEILSSDFDERDPGVLEMIKQAVAGAKRKNAYSGLCGQAPSDYPEMAEFLVEQGIGSMSLNPDAVIKTTRLLLEIEARMANTQ